MTLEYQNSLTEARKLPKTLTLYLVAAGCYHPLVLLVGSLNVDFEPRCHSLGVIEAEAHLA